MQGKKGLIIGLGLAVVVLLAVGGYFGLVYYSSQSLKANVDKMIAEVKDEGTITYKSLTTKPFAMAVEMEDFAFVPKDKKGKFTAKQIVVTGSRGAGFQVEPTAAVVRQIEINAKDDNLDFPVKINEIEISGVERQGKLTTKATTYVRGVIIDAASLKEQERGEFTRIFKTDKLVMDGQYVHDYHVDKKELQGKLIINGKDLWESSLILRLGNVDADKLSQENFKKNDDLLQLLALVSDLSVINLELRFKNLNLVQNLIKFTAERAGLDSDTLVKALQQQVEQAKDYLPMLGQVPPEVEKAVTNGIAAVKQFLEQPRSLKLSIAPAKPVAVASLLAVATNPGRVLKELNVSLTADGP